MLSGFNAIRARSVEPGHAPSRQQNMRHGAKQDPRDWTEKFCGQEVCGGEGQDGDIPNAMVMGRANKTGVLMPNCRNKRWDWIR